jgi:hypothetical protein
VSDYRVKLREDFDLEGLVCEMMPKERETRESECEFGLSER